MTTNPTRDRLEIPDVLDEMIGDTLCDVQTLREQVRKYLNEAHRAGYREGAAAVSAAVEGVAYDLNAYDCTRDPVPETLDAAVEAAAKVYAHQVIHEDDWRDETYDWTERIRPLVEAAAPHIAAAGAPGSGRRRRSRLSHEQWERYLRDHADRIEDDHAD